MFRADELAAEQEKERAAREKRAQTIETLTQEFDDKISAVVGHLGAATTQMQSTASSMAAIAEETNRHATAAATACGQPSSTAQPIAPAAPARSTSLPENTHRTTP